MALSEYSTRSRVRPVAAVEGIVAVGTPDHVGARVAQKAVGLVRSVKILDPDKGIARGDAGIGSRRLQIDAQPGGAVGIHRPVAAARPAIQPVRTGTAQKDVVVRPSLQHVVAVPALDKVIPRAPGQSVGQRISGKCVGVSATRNVAGKVPADVDQPLYPRRVDTQSAGEGVHLMVAVSSSRQANRDAAAGGTGCRPVDDQNVVVSDRGPHLDPINAVVDGDAVVSSAGPQVVDLTARSRHDGVVAIAGIGIAVAGVAAQSLDARDGTGAKAEDDVIQDVDGDVRHEAAIVEAPDIVARPHVDHGASTAGRDVVIARAAADGVVSISGREGIIAGAGFDVEPFDPGEADTHELRTTQHRELPIGQVAQCRTVIHVARCIPPAQGESVGASPEIDDIRAAAKGNPVVPAVGVDIVVQLQGRGVDGIVARTGVERGVEVGGIAQPLDPAERARDPGQGIGSQVDRNVGRGRRVVRAPLVDAIAAVDHGPAGLREDVVIAGTGLNGIVAIATDQKVVAAATENVETLDPRE